MLAPKTLSVRLRSGLSLVELLVVVAIVGILLALGISYMAAAIRYANSFEAQINLIKKSIGGTRVKATPPASTGQLIGGRYIVVLRDDVDPQQELRRLAHITPLQAIRYYNHAFKGFAIQASADSVPVLLADSAVQYVEQDQTLLLAALSGNGVATDMVPSSLHRIHAGATDAMQHDVDADIAIIDTGVDHSTTELKVSNREAFGYADDAKDVDGHGTQVASIAAAMANKAGILGVAPGARIWALKVTDKDNSGSAIDLVAALDYVVQHAAEIDVVNVSVLTGHRSAAVNLAAANCVQAGVVVVAAAGNHRRDAGHFSPASEASVITVAALADTDGKDGGKGPKTSAGDPDDTFARFSNYGAAIDFLAPGVNITTVDLANEPSRASGTSFAAAHVTGLVARMRDQSLQVLAGRSRAALTPDAIRLQLSAKSREIIPGPANRSYQLIDAGLTPAPAVPAALNMPTGIPLSYEPNVGQADPQVRYLTRARGYMALLTNQGMVVSAGGAAQRIQFANANPNPTITGMSRLPGYANYFIGPDASQWRTNIPTCREVYYGNVYPGVDVLFYSDERRVRYDMIVAPGADPTQITLTFPDAVDVEVERGGHLQIKVNGGSMQQSPPIVYQQGAYGPEKVDGRYVVVAPRQVKFAFGPYDRTRPLVIDPIVFSTFRGGSSFDGVYGMSLDPAGNVYLTGETNSSNFPVTSPFQATHGGGFTDVFVSKINAAGTAVLYSTYVGGVGGEEGRDIAVNVAGEAFVVGGGSGPSGTVFPTTAGSIEPINHAATYVVVFRLNAAGNALIYSAIPNTFSGEYGYGIAIDAANNAYITGQGGDASFAMVPTAGVVGNSFPKGFDDAFVMKIDPPGTKILYFTYLGGSSGETGYSIKVDAAGNAYIAGETNSADLVTTPGVVQPTSGGGSGDGFVVKLNPTATAMLYSTYQGGSTRDIIYRIAVDGAGNVYSTGETGGGTFVTTAGAPQSAFQGGFADAFVRKLNPTGTALLYSTFLGSNGGDTGQAITIDAAGNAYVTGQAGSTTFPNVNPVQLPGNNDAFVTGINPAGTAFFFSSHLGGTFTENGRAIALDASGAIWVAGDTSSTNFPTASALQAAIGGSSDAFLTKLTPGGAPVPGVTITQSGGSTTVTEGGATDTYTVVLDSAPAFTVFINLSTSSQLSLSPPFSLVFTSANWNVPQTVTVTAANDSVVEGPHSATITHTSSSGDSNYNGLSIASVTANITDNDTAGVVIVESGGSTDVEEQFALSDTYTIALTSQPTGNVTINVNLGTQVSAVFGTTFTFTPLNWSFPQTMFIRAVDDAVVEGPHTATITHTATSTDTNYNGIAVPNVIANIKDNDNIAGVIITPTGGSNNVTEGGATDTYSVVLAGPPAFFSVTVGVSSLTQVNISPSLLIFTTGNWNVPQTVTITPINDSIDEGPHTGTIQHTVSSLDPGYSSLTVPPITVNITDNDVAGVTVVESGGSTDVDEASILWDTYTVVLNSQPSANVTVTINPGTQVTSVAGTTLIFTPLNWSFAQTVLIRAVDDAVVEGPHTATITHTMTSTDPKYNGMAVPNVIAKVTDNDFLAGVTITQTGPSTDVAEGGATDTYSIVLINPPAFFSVNISINAGTQASVSPSSVSFNTANWNVPQTITVTAVNDFVMEGPHTATITHTASSLDTNYNGIAINNVVANITDNDFAGVTVTPSGGSTAVTEGGPTDTYTVVLTSQPTANVSVAIASGSQLTAAPASLTFTAANWNVAQTVTVTAVDDTVIEGPHGGTITHAVTSADPNYNGIAAASVTATITDNDFPVGVTVNQSGGSTVVAEGGGGDSYTVVLISAPTANVTITVTPDAQATVSPATLTFTPANWATPQTVTVTPVDDTKKEGNPHYGVIAHTATSTDTRYNGIPVASVQVVVQENDFPAPDAADTSEMATPLGPVTGFKGFFGLDTLRKPNGRFDDDWYSCIMTKNGRFTVDLKNVSVYCSGPRGQFSFGDVHFRLYRVTDGILTEIGSSQVNGKTITVDVLQDERILIWVYGLFFTQADYDFTIDLK